MQMIANNTVPTIQDGRNIPPLATLQPQLESAAILTSRLIHDFGNYLTGIMGFTELSQGQADPESTLGRYLQEVMLSAKQGADWIRRLHLFCRRGASPYWPALLSGILQAEEARVRTAGSNLRWLTNVSGDLPLLAIDGPTLQTAISEIVNNTREATRDQGTLNIGARLVALTAQDASTMFGAFEPGEFVELTFVDDGPGFTADASAKTFREIFFSTKPRHRGLGLLVVYGIMQRYRGGMRWSTGGRGAGVEIRLYLPLAELGEEKPATPHAPHLLLAHEDALLTETMRRILERKGWRITVVGSSSAAVSAYQAPKQNFDLVLADILLTGMSGPEMARKILDYDSKANFLFLYAQSSFHGFADEELLKRFPLLRWPTDVSVFVQAIQTALAAPGKPESGKSTR